MLDPAVKRAIVESMWISLCTDAASRLGKASRDWSPEAHSLVADKVEEFSMQPAPDTIEELDVRRMQDAGLWPIIDCVSNIERSTLGRADRLRMAQSACALKLPATKEEHTKVLLGTMAISHQISSMARSVHFVRIRR
jgi:hypothetical protein